MEIIEENKKSFVREIDVFDLLKQLWNSKLYILFIIIIFFLWSLFYLKDQPQIYSVDASVIPTKNNLSSAPNNSGSLNSLINLSLGNKGSEGANEFNLYLSSFKSRVVASVIAEDKDLMKRIFSNEWDQEKNSWMEVKPSRVQSFKNIIRQFLNFPIFGYQEPNIDRVELLLQKILIYSEISGNSNNAINYISVKTSRPQLWIDLIEKIHNITDNFLRDRELERTSEYINFLNAKINLTNNLAQKEALIRGLAEQLKNKMIASADIPYAAEIYTSPYSSSRPIYPKMTNTILMFLISGFILGCFGTFIGNFVYKRIKSIK